MFRRFLFVAAALAAVAGFGAAASVDDASGKREGPQARRMLLGIYDDAQALGRPERSFPLFGELRAQIVRVNLYWGGPTGVARNARPKNALDPNDEAYDWRAYDEVLWNSELENIKVVFSIYGTPGWANGRKGVNRAPTRAQDLKDFAFAAAKRYSGTFDPPGDTETLPPVRHWLAWNEPNNPIFLRPQFRKVGRRHVIQSAKDYAKICNAVYAGVHRTRLPNQKVACGVTAPRGNNYARSPRPSVSPLAFMRAMKAAGVRRFDAYAHHPYYGKRFETPATPPKLGKLATGVILGNLNVLVRELTRLWGPRRLWITEYGYQTNPPDRIFGVTPAQQAKYLRQAYTIARKNPRVDMMLWFLLRDDPRLQGWQSGLMTVRGARKPAFRTFQSLAG